MFHFPTTALLDRDFSCENRAERCRIVHREQGGQEICSGDSSLHVMSGNRDERLDVGSVIERIVSIPRTKKNEKS